MKRLLVALTVVTVASALQAQQRTLSWKSLNVKATLDRDGELRVSETHEMLFNGDWNGGERKFRVERGQQLQLLSVSRVDPVSGKSRPLSASSGGGIGLDQYAFDGTTLRWRARRAGDPPFRNRELTFVIDYTLRNVVARQGEGYILEHDFAFADRPGVIEQYRLELELDPAWQPAPGFMPMIERANLPPGESVILDIPLGWSGEGQPAHIASAATPAAATIAPVPAQLPPERLPLMVRLLAFLLFFGVAFLLAKRFLRNEEKSGRYAPPPQITRDWLEKNLLVHRAEVVGSAWDRRTGQGEVAALIAIMAGEGKIKNVPGAPPRLKLLVPRAGLSDYERGFVDRLFIRGDEIDPATLRYHYSGTGFDPAASIRGPLQAMVGPLVGPTGGLAASLLGCAGFLLLLPILPVMGGAAAGPWGAMVGLAGAFVFLLTALMAWSYRYRLGKKQAARTIPIGLIVVAAAISAMATISNGLVVFLAVLMVLQALLLESAAWRGTPEQLLNLRNFRAVRDFFRRRLAEGDAALDERWIPYILAFGLNNELDQWFVAAPPQATSQWSTFHSSVNPSGGSSSVQAPPSGQAPPSFKPGGGGFGGAGATGGWASSIASFAAAVPAPSSSGSSSGWSSGSSSSGSFGSSSGSSSSGSSGSRSSGGSSSGGGGGGGW